METLKALKTQKEQRLLREPRTFPTHLQGN